MSFVLNPFSSVISEDIETILKKELPWQQLAGKHVVVTGASGMLASYLVETLLNVPGVRVTGTVRNTEKAWNRFRKYSNHPDFQLVSVDYSKPIHLPPCNIIIHAASIPRPDTKIPVDVLEPNIIGTWNLLQYARQCPAFEQFVFFSSHAVYGDNTGSERPIRETDFFPIPFTDVKSCYSVGKLAGETICMSFKAQYGISVKTLRYVHTYGPGMDLEHDPRSFVDFIRRVLDGKNIELLSSGEAKRSFCYIADATEAFFRILFLGKSGEAFNISNPGETISIYELAEMLVSLFPDQGLKVVRKNNKNSDGYAPLGKIDLQDISKLTQLQWTAETPVREGFTRTIHAYVKKMNCDRRINGLS